MVNNLIVSAKLNVDAHCRVLLTTPIETFTIGHTIVISRGLIDVLPDEASLALVLAAELSHIALGHPTPTQFAFHNQTMLTDAELLQRFRFERRPRNWIARPGKKTIEIMRASPYQKTGNAGLFLKALASRGPHAAAACCRQPRKSGRQRRGAEPGWPNSPPPRPRSTRKAGTDRRPAARLAREAKSLEQPHRRW